MKIKATRKFLELGIENSYQGLKTDDYYALRNGKTIELSQAPSHLLGGKYIEKVKEYKKKEVK